MNNSFSIIKCEKKLIALANNDKKGGLNIKKFCEFCGIGHSSFYRRFNKAEGFSKQLLLSRLRREINPYSSARLTVVFDDALKAMAKDKYMFIKIYLTLWNNKQICFCKDLQDTLEEQLRKYFKVHGIDYRASELNHSCVAIISVLTVWVMHDLATPERDVYNQVIAYINPFLRHRTVW